jgi:hypothetical protein
MLTENLKLRIEMTLGARIFMELANNTWEIAGNIQITKTVTKLLIVLTAIFATTLAVNAQDKKDVKDTSNGYSFSVPEDWVNQEANGGYVLTNSEKTANIIVKKHSYKNYAEYSKGDGDYERDGFTRLLETTDLGNGNSHDRVTKDINGKYLIFDAVFIVSEYEGGLLLLGVSTDDKSAKASINGITELVKTLKFFEPKKSPQDAATKKAFGGKRLSYMQTLNGFSESRRIWLCKSGSYFSRNQSSSLSQLGSGLVNNEDRGTWEVQKSGNSITLILRSQSGNLRSFQVTPRQASNEISLNGNRYFVEEHSECN